MSLVSTTNLEGLWRFGTDSAAEDTSGKGRDLTTLTNLEWEADASGVGINLSFADRSVIRAAYGSTVNASSWSGISVTLFASSLADPGGLYPRPFTFGTYDTNGFSLYVSPTTFNVAAEIYRAGAHEAISSLTPFPDLDIHMIAFTLTFASKAWVFYFDGTPTNNGTLTNSPVAPNGKIVVGNIDTPATITGWIGLIGRVRLYSTALTASDVLNLYNNPWQTEAGAGWLRAEKKKVGLSSILSDEEILNFYNNS